MDQCAFRPTGSTTAAIIAILQSVTELLLCKSYVVVIIQDFSKAFDTVLHSTVIHKMASMNIAVDVYNYQVDLSGQLDVSASIMQGSAIGPASYVVSAEDLTTVIVGNLMFKCADADDTYIIIPAVNADSSLAELDRVDRWAQNNNGSSHKLQAQACCRSASSDTRHPPCDPPLSCLASP